MSMRDLPAPNELYTTRSRSTEQRLRRLEAGSVLKGRPSVAELQIGDLVLSVDASASPTLTLVATNLITGTTAVVVTIT